MNSDFYLIIKIFFNATAGGCAILSAWFELKDRAQTESKRLASRKGYTEKWLSIKDCGILQLPETAVRWFIALKHNNIFSYSRILHLNRNRYGLLLFIPTTLGFIIHFIYGDAKLVSAFIFLLLLVIGTNLLWFKLYLLRQLSFIDSTNIQNVINEYFTKFRFLFSFFYILSSTTLYYFCLYLYIKSKLSPLVISIILLLNVPITSSIISGPLSYFYISLSKKLQKRSLGKLYGIWDIIGISTAFSFFFTSFSLYIGHYFDQKILVYPTFKILLVNYLFDLLTVATTFIVLEKAIIIKKIYAIPIAIFIDIIMASIFACSSVFFALFNTKYQISIFQTIYILIGRSINNESFNFGPFFWLMHTTFLPTFFCLFFILICWFCKLVVLPISELLYKGSLVKQPHHLTAGALLFIATLFGVCSGLLGYISEILK